MQDLSAETVRDLNSVTKQHNPCRLSVVEDKQDSPLLPTTFEHFYKSIKQSKQSPQVMFCVDSNKAPQRAAAFIIIINFRLDNRHKLTIEICSKERKGHFKTSLFYREFR